MKISDNLKALRKRHKQSQEEVAQALGLTRSSYSGYENNVAEPGLETIIKVGDYFSMPLDVLLKKDLTVFDESDWERVERGLYNDVMGKNLRVLSTVVDTNEEELIEMIPQQARAGYTTGYSDPEYLKVLPTFSLPFLSKNRKYRSFPIEGDSMPPVVPGSYVVAEFVQNWMSIRDKTPCIIVTKEDGIVFKIVENRLMKDQVVVLYSTNPLYEPYAVHANSILEIWKFVNYISPELPEVRPDDATIAQSINQINNELRALKEVVDKR